jgi:pimeloyl-ACP methyl ester carboxylesterase
VTWLLEQVETALRTSLRDRPVLTTFGHYNDPLPFQPRWCELLPHAQQVVIAGGNHSPHERDPYGVAVAIWSWRRDSS